VSRSVSRRSSSAPARGDGPAYLCPAIRYVVTAYSTNSLASEAVGIRTQMRQTAGVCWIRKALTSPRMLVVICRLGWTNQAGVTACGWLPCKVMLIRVPDGSQCKVRRITKEKLAGKGKEHHNMEIIWITVALSSKLDLGLSDRFAGRGPIQPHQHRRAAKRVKSHPATVPQL
jgi:hypothetical protein